MSATPGILSCQTIQPARQYLGMSYKGKVRNGVVVLPPEAKLSEGEEVEVTPLGNPPVDDFTDTLVRISKKVAGLPPDLAAQHDHYLYGTPKR